MAKKAGEKKKVYRRFLDSARPAEVIKNYRIAQ